MQTKIILISLTLLVSACSFSDFGFPGVYRLDIPQGNIVNQEMVDQLKPGMTRRQVRYVMGTPLVVDSFEAERWDYVYSIEKRTERRTQQRVTLYFDGDVLVRIEGDLAPSDANVPAGAEQADSAQSEEA